jgi:hypothetical protein
MHDNERYNLRGSGFTIHKNNMHDNERYNLRLGDFNTENVDARQNWWGTHQPLETIFDDRREPGIGRVEFDPFALEPLPIPDDFFPLFSLPHLPAALNRMMLNCVVG